MADTFVKVRIYAPDIVQAERLAATMDLHLRQWEWVGPYEYTPDITWASVQPLFDRIRELEENV